MWRVLIVDGDFLNRKLIQDIPAHDAERDLAADLLYETINGRKPRPCPPAANERQ